MLKLNLKKGVEFMSKFLKIVICFLMIFMFSISNIFAYSMVFKINPTGLFLSSLPPVGFAIAFPNEFSAFNIEFVRSNSRSLNLGFGFSYANLSDYNYMSGLINIGTRFYKENAPLSFYMFPQLGFGYVNINNLESGYDDFLIISLGLKIGYQWEVLRNVTFDVNTGISYISYISKGGSPQGFIFTPITFYVGFLW